MDEQRERVAYANGLAGFMASGSWYDQPVVMANNTFADSPDGFDLGIRAALSDANTGFFAVNNIFVHLQRFAVAVGDRRILQGQVDLDHDLFHLVGYESWPSHTPGILAGHVDGSGYRELPGLEDVRAIGFEADGRVGDPLFAGYDPSITDGSWQDFRLSAASVEAIDTGGPLPERLVVLLEKFGLNDGRKGAELDRGALEFDPDDPAAPFVIDVGPTDGSAEIVTPWADEELPPDIEPPADAGGCGCRAVGGPGPSGCLSLLVLCVALVAGRVRRGFAR